MISQKKMQREMVGIALCVIGLSVNLIGVFIFIGKCDLSVILGIILGGATSILNYSLYVLTMQISAKYDSQKATLITWLSKVFRMLFMIVITFIILVIPLLHNVGIIALFFPHISRVIMSLIKKSHNKG